MTSAAAWQRRATGDDNEDDDDGDGNGDQLLVIQRWIVKINKKYV